MDPDDLFQVWSSSDGEVMRIVGSDFTFCLFDLRDEQFTGTFELQGKDHIPGDMRTHYLNASEMGFWKRIT